MFFAIFILLFSLLAPSLNSCMEDPRKFDSKIGNRGSALQQLSVIMNDPVIDVSQNEAADHGETTSWDAKVKNWKIEAQKLQEQIHQRESRLAQEVGELHMAKSSYHAAFMPLPQGTSETKQVSPQSYHSAFLPLPSIPNPAFQATEEWLAARDAQERKQEETKRLREEAELRRKHEELNAPYTVRDMIRLRKEVAIQKETVRTYQLAKDKEVKLKIKSMASGFGTAAAILALGIKLHPGAGQIHGWQENVALTALVISPIIGLIGGAFGSDLIFSTGNERKELDEA